MFRRQFLAARESAMGRRRRRLAGLRVSGPIAATVLLAGGVVACRPVAPEVAGVRDGGGRGQNLPHRQRQEGHRRHVIFDSLRLKGPLAPGRVELAQIAPVSRRPFGDVGAHVERSRY